MKGKYKIILLFLGVMLVLCFIVSASYAYYMFSISQSGYNAVSGDCFKITFENGDALSIGDAIPLSDVEGSELEPFIFSIKNVCNYNMNYSVNIETLNQTTMDIEAVKVKLNNYNSRNLGSTRINDESFMVNSNAISSRSVDRGIIAGNATKEFELRLWIDENATYEQSGNKVFASKVVVSATVTAPSTLISGQEFNKVIKELADIQYTQNEIDGYNKAKNEYLAGDYDPPESETYQGFFVRPNEEDVQDVTFFSKVFDYDNFYLLLDDYSIKGFNVVSELPVFIADVIVNGEDSPYYQAFEDFFRVVSTPDSEDVIYAWYINNYIYLYNIDGKIVLNPDSSFLFSGLANLSSIDLSYFDTSIVNDMSYMFYEDKNIEYLDLTSSDTRSVNNMREMFKHMDSLKSIDLGGKFDTSFVTDMSGMFSYLLAIEELDLNNINTSSVMDMSYMFYETPVVKSLNLGNNFDTSNVRNMRRMFSNIGYKISPYYDNKDYPEDISLDADFSNAFVELDLGDKFNTVNVENMSHMFDGLDSLSALDLKDKFDTSNVKDMSWMFADVFRISELNLGNKFDTSSVTNMSGMFYRSVFLENIMFGDKFDTSNVEDMHSMFAFSQKIRSLNLGFFNTSKVKNMSTMFFGMSNMVTINLGRNFDTSSVINMAYMFAYDELLSRIYSIDFVHNDDLIYDSMYNNCGSLVGPISGLNYLLSLSEIDLSRVDDPYNQRPGLFWNVDIYENEEYALGSDFNSIIKKLVDENATDRTEDTTITAFLWSDELPSDLSVAKNVASITFKHPIYVWLDGTTVYYHSESPHIYLIEGYRLFSNFKSIETIDLSHIDTSLTVSMAYMFFNDVNLSNIVLNNFNTSNVFDMSYMFYNTNSLINLDLSSFNTSNVHDMSNMFFGCGVGELDLSSFDTSNVVNMTNMFSYMLNITSLDLSSFNTSKVTGMSLMFFASQRIRNLNLSSFDTSNVKYMYAMFEGMPLLESIDISSFDTSKVTTFGSMFTWDSNLKTIYVGNNWSTSSAENGSKMFDSCSKLVGGAGTKYSSSHVDLAYAHVDGGTANPGYFTLKVN